LIEVINSILVVQDLINLFLSKLHKFILLFID